RTSDEFAMKPSEESSAPAALARIPPFIGTIGVLVSLLLAPPVFSRLFAMSFLLASEQRALWLGCGLLLAASILVAVNPSRRRLDLAAGLFALLVLLGLELGARFAVAQFQPEAKHRLAQLANRTYPELMAYTGHPFLQFTGNPSRRVVEDRVLGDLSSFNNLGFLGEDFVVAKPPGTVRIAALGGSTTASGYPYLMGLYLNEHEDRGDRTFEVLNFGQGWYSTAHSLVNLVLNVLDLEPDVIVIHHAWNDKAVRDAGDQFRSDYSHALSSFQPPDIPDRHLIRASIWYRFFKHRITPQPDWAFLDRATVTELGRKPDKRYDNPEELRTYRRNLATMIDLAGLRGIRVVLTTQPRSQDPEAKDAAAAPHIDQCNAIVRELAAEYPNVIFVDLDREMTGVMEDVFLDLAHVDGVGRRVKAKAIGEALLGALDVTSPNAVGEASP
ncbi:MAG: GDSL-type esterase/lipase family protein, partial [Acidobacteriota bacterium]